jgi:hypothetical protein
MEHNISWECLNCHNQFTASFAGLEEMRKEKGHYCSKCHGTEKPVNEPEPFDSQEVMWGENSKCKSTIMTVKEIVDLAESDKLVGYPSEENIRWDNEDRKDFEDFLLEGKGFALSFFLILTAEGIYEVFDGKQRISILFHLLEKCDKQETEMIEKMECKVKVLINNSPKELINLRKKYHVNETFARRNLLTLEKHETVIKLLKHEFFKNCLIQGDKIRMADVDCVEVLLAFCYNDFQSKAEVRTLPSNLKKFVAEKPPYNEKKGYGKDPNETLDLMNHIFSNTNYLCRAVDFCYMAVLNLCLDLCKRFRETTEEDYKTLYEEYDHMMSELTPCVTLNPLAAENLEKVQMYFKDMVLRIFDPEYLSD